MSMPRISIVLPLDCETCSRELLLERLKIAETLLQNYVYMYGSQTLINSLEKQRASND